VKILKKYGWLLIILLALIAAIILRIILPWNTIFTPNGVIFTGVDAYYYAHLADLISNNNMQIPTFDSYFDFPNGLDYTALPSSFNAYGIFIAILAWVFSLGHPTKQIVDIVSAIHPAILGILALIPIFFITKKLTKNNWVASGAMLLGAVMPGEYMGRASLGSADTHCLEIFLFSFVVMFTVLALNGEKRRVLWIILSGLIGIAYLLIWQGAVIFTVLLAIFAIMWLMWTRYKGQTDYENTCVIASILSIILIGYLAVSYKHISNNLLTLVAPLVGVVAFLIYTGLTQKARNWVYFIPLLVLGAIGIGLVVSFPFVSPSFYPYSLANVIQQALNLVLWHVSSTTAEELPILITLGTVTPNIPWAYFSFTWYIAFAGIGILAYQWRKTDINISFLLVWTILMIVPTLAMRRFAYYSAINIIIVTAWTLWVIVKFILRKD
jgi:dolichyl-diphosphooligosaccharide--protein glycosyltransferase